MYGKACINIKEMFGRMFEHCRKGREEVKLKTKCIQYEITRIS
jgi:hypothetical protein